MSSAETKNRDRPEKFDVLAIGLNAVDILARLPETVETGQKHRIEQVVVQGGAPAANAACVASALGWKTGFVGYFGDNTLSMLAREDFRKHGISDTYFLFDPVARPAASVITIDPVHGERTIFYSLESYRHLSASDVCADAVRQSRLLLLDGYEPEAALASLKAAERTDTLSVLDVESGETDVLRELIALATDVVLPLDAAKRLSGKSVVRDVLQELARWTNGQLIVTDGTAGSWAATPVGVLHQPAVPVVTVDTTGCGDAYHGAYASALLDGLTLPMRMEFASWVAARTASAVGGRTLVPHRGDFFTATEPTAGSALLHHLKSIARWSNLEGVSQ